MNKKTVLLSAVGALSLSLVAPAIAQDSVEDEPEARRLGTVNVSAQKRDETIFDVPLSVQALDSEAIENSGVEDVAGLVKLIPSASVVSSTSRGFDTIQIRGIAAGTTGDGLTGYYVDDFAFGVPNLQLSPPARLLDLEQVEVIRGPSGTIWGQGSMGGNIRLITADPDVEVFSGKLVGEYSNTEGGSDNYAIDGVLNIPVSDTFAIRISGGYDELSGYADVLQSGEDEANGSRGENIRVKALWTPTDQLSIRGTIWTIDNEQDFNNNLVRNNPITGAPLSEPQIDAAGSITNGPVAGFTNTSMDIASLAIQYDFAGYSVVSSTAYTEHELDFEAPFTLAFSSFNNNSTFETESFTQEVRVSTDNDDAFQWIAGVYYRNATIDSDINFFIDATDFLLGELPLISLVGPLQTESISIFGEASLELFDGKLVPLVGFRYFEDERTADPGLDRILMAATPGASVNFDSVSPRFNLTYRPNENATIYFNAAHGFRSGTLQTQNQVDTAVLLGVPAQVGVEPDELWSYELGGKFAAADGTLLLDGAIYQTEWSDVQQPFGPLSSVANVGDATIQGIDLGFAWLTPLEGLSVQAAANFQDTEWDTVVPNITTSLPFVTPGGELLAVPERTFSFSASYETELAIFEGSDLALNATFANRSDTLQQTGMRTDDISDLSLSADLATGYGWSIGLFGHNLTDEDGATQFSPYDGESFVRLYPRRIGLKVGVDF